MSRSRTRARNRRARLEESRAAFARARDDPEDFSKYLQGLADDDTTPIWPIAEAASKDRPLDDSERAMISQAVAPHLVGMIPGSVRNRHAILSAMKNREEESHLYSSSK